MADTPDAELDEIAEEFDVLGDWEERYRYLIDLGRALPSLADTERTDANRVRGCASQVWLVRTASENGRSIYRGDSDAHIVRGLVAIVLRLYSNRTPGEIADFDARAGFDRLGLAGALSAQRANGLAAMVDRIRRDASELAA